MDIKKYVSAIAIALSMSLAQAGVTYNNGGPVGDSGRCISGPYACGGSGNWTVYDQFSIVPADGVTLTGFANWNVQRSAGNYLGTNWSIWSASPADTGVMLYSGTSIATITSDQGYRLATVDGLSINLAAGTYWLGINHTVDSWAEWSYAYSTFQPDNAVQKDGDSYTFVDQKALAFTVSAVPEPTTYAMLLAGLGILGFAARRKRTAT